jgi:hypothetical protein
MIAREHESAAYFTLTTGRQNGKEEKL